MEERKIFVPHELKTIEIDVEKKIFRVNGEDFGRDCDEFTISCSTKKERGDDEYLKVGMRINTTVKYANYNWNGEKMSEEGRQLKK